jgi:hypothetical protein
MTIVILVSYYQGPLATVIDIRLIGLFLTTLGLPGNLKFWI